MKFFWDERRIDRLEMNVNRLEKKVDDGFDAMRAEFAAVRSESRADFRTLLAILLPMFLTMILGLAGILLRLS